MKRGDIMLASPHAVYSRQRLAHGEERSCGGNDPEGRLLVMLVEPLRDCAAWRCYSPECKATYSFWEYELEAR